MAAISGTCHRHGARQRWIEKVVSSTARVSGSPVGSNLPTPISRAASMTASPGHVPCAETLTVAPPTVTSRSPSANPMTASLLWLNRLIFASPRRACSNSRRRTLTLAICPLLIRFLLSRGVRPHHALQVSEVTLGGLPILRRFHQPELPPFFPATKVAAKNGTRSACADSCRGGACPIAVECSLVSDGKEAGSLLFSAFSCFRPRFCGTTQTFLVGSPSLLRPQDR